MSRNSLHRRPKPWAVPVAEELILQIDLLYRWFEKPADPHLYEQLVFQWARAIDHTAYPPNVYLEALDILVSESSSRDNPPMPGDILRRCQRALERVEVDPERREGLRKWREERERERDSRVKPV